MLAETFCPPGKWTSIPAPPSVTASVADPSMNTWIHASCGYISLSNHSQGEGLLYRIILCVSIREWSDCGMDLDVSYVRYPGLWHVCWEEGKCALGQSVVKLAAQLLALMDKTASFKPILGETFQPGFHGMVCQALELFCLHHVLGIPPLTKRLNSCEPLHFCDRSGPHCTSDQTECLFWTLSNACWLVFAVVDHAEEPYSRWGLTVPWYTVLSIFSLAPQVVPASLRRVSILRLAFAFALAMCCFQVGLLSNVIPRYVASHPPSAGSHQEWWCRLCALGTGWTRWWKICPFWLQHTICLSSCWAWQQPAASCMWL